MNYVTRDKRGEGLTMCFVLTFLLAGRSCLALESNPRVRKMRRYPRLPNPTLIPGYLAESGPVSFPRSQDFVV